DRRAGAAHDRRDLPAGPGAGLLAADIGAARQLATRQRRAARLVYRRDLQADPEAVRAGAPRVGAISGRDRLAAAGLQPARSRATGDERRTQFVPTDRPA